MQTSHNRNGTFIIRIQRALILMTSDMTLMSSFSIVISVLAVLHQTKQTINICSSILGNIRRLQCVTPYGGLCLAPADG